MEYMLIFRKRHHVDSIALHHIDQTSLSGAGELARAQVVLYSAPKVGQLDHTEVCVVPSPEKIPNLHDASNRRRR